MAARGQRREGEAKPGRGMRWEIPAIETQKPMKAYDRQFG